MALTRKETTIKSVALNTENVIKVFSYIQDEVAKHYPQAEFEASINKTDKESTEEITNPTELDSELSDIHDLRLVRSIEIEAHDYSNNFHVQVLLDANPVWHRAVSINIRSKDKSMAVSLDRGIHDKLGYSKNINWLARAIWPYIVVPPLLGFAAITLVIYSFHLNLKWIWWGGVLSWIFLFLPQDKIEKFYPAVILTDKNQTKTNGRMLSKDLKRIAIWIALLILGGVILRAVGLS